MNRIKALPRPSTNLYLHGPGLGHEAGHTGASSHVHLPIKVTHQLTAGEVQGLLVLLVYQAAGC